MLPGLFVGSFPVFSESWGEVVEKLHSESNSRGTENLDITIQPRTVIADPRQCVITTMYDYPRLQSISRLLNNRAP